MADPVTKDDLEKFRAEMTKMVKDATKSIQRVLRLVKAYPQIKSPDSGDSISKAMMATVNVAVKSNKMLWTHWVEFRHENMDPVSMSTREPVDFSVGGATLTVPDPGTYLLLCYLDSDSGNLTNPTHHVAKIDVEVIP